MDALMETLTIAHFRALKSLKVEGLRRVNLITGRNNTGKSSLLEALRILGSGGQPAVLFGILRYREEDTRDGEVLGAQPDPETLNFLLNLFTGFPEFSEQLEPILIKGSGPARAPEIMIKPVLVKNEDPQNANQGMPTILVEGSAGRFHFSRERFREEWILRPRGRPQATGEPAQACVWVSPYCGQQTSTLAALWDKVALSDGEKDVVEALRIIHPAISAVSMVGGEDLKKRRIAIVRASNLPHPVPLRSFGDGMNRLFGIVLSLVNAKDGLVLIDEFENGMHHTVQLDAWRAVFKLARRLGIQVFATTHSWDCIETFQKAASEIPEEGSLVRLSCRGEDIIPTMFADHDLEVVTRERIEVR